MTDEYTLQLMQGMFAELQAQIDDILDGDVQVKEAEYAAEAGGAPEIAFADLPSTVETNMWYYVTDGRKVGEGASAGTGVMCWGDPNTNTFYSVMDGSAVAV